MPDIELTGRRIRDRRVALGLKQGGLAIQVGISPSYLNLIEHNRRRIGGKLLVDIARALEVDPSTLSHGAEAALLADLLSAAANQMESDPEVGQTEVFAARFPGWAGLLAKQSRRVAALERQVESLTDRLAHDPTLSGALHEVLSTAAAIRSTAAILVDPQEMEQVWRDRFQRNLYEDSVRLAESTQALVSYMDRDEAAASTFGTPIDALEGYLQSCDFHLPALEQGGAGIAAEVAKSTLQGSTAETHFTRYQRDANAMPLEPFLAAAQEVQYDPAKLAQRFGVDIAAAMRRIATLPCETPTHAVGLAICDGAGTLTLRKPIDGFPLPRFSASHPDWPLYQALSRANMPIRQCVQQGQGNAARKFLVYAIGQSVSALSFEAPPQLEATMLILPAARAPEATNSAPDLILSPPRVLGDVAE